MVELVALHGSCRLIDMDFTDEDTVENGEYFCLRIDTDPHARDTLAHYAYSIQHQQPDLAQALLKWLDQTPFRVSHEHAA